MQSTLMTKPLSDNSEYLPVRFVQVTEHHAGQRVDNFLLREVKGAPRSLIYRWLRKGEVRVNKKRAKPTQKLCIADQVRLPPVQLNALQSGEPEKPPPKLVTDLQAGIVFEDDHLIVLNKPSGVAAHGGTGIAFGVIEALRTVRSDGLELVHRLDRETSGVMLLTKNRAALLNLQQQLQAGDAATKLAEKHYLTLVVGRWHEAQTVDASLLRGHDTESAESLTLVDDAGKAAVSHFRPLEIYPALSNLNVPFTSMEVRIETGRMHQIRAHAAYMQHALAGDRKYGDREVNNQLRKFGLRRCFLHAHRLAFHHPDSGERMDFNVPLPNDLRAVLDALAIV